MPIQADYKHDHYKKYINNFSEKSAKEPYEI